jgi:hypothetical protein
VIVPMAMGSVPVSRLHAWRALNRCEGDSMTKQFTFEQKCQNLQASRSEHENCLRYGDCQMVGNRRVCLIWIPPTGPHLLFNSTDVMSWCPRFARGDLPDQPSSCGDVDAYMRTDDLAERYAAPLYPARQYRGPRTVRTPHSRTARPRLPLRPVILDIFKPNLRQYVQLQHVDTALAKHTRWCRCI